MPRTPLLAHLTIALTALAAVCGPAAFAAPQAPQAVQAPPPENGSLKGPARPRIGLALGGGSARGLAHIGVLEWLEEHRIPIDAVAGTSMGGLLGGAYATGISMPEIRTLASESTWEAALSTEAPFEDKTFRRKQDRRAFPAGIELAVRRGLWLPGGLNPGQGIAMLLDRLTLPYSALPTFDDLPTPFRCVAFDINRSEGVVLGSGVLAEAMRATMAIPGMFPPVTIDGRLLVDGGLLNNVPAAAARQMNVDVVIAVDVSQDPASIPYVTAFSAVVRAVDAVMVAGVKRNLASADVVIAPDLKDVGSTDWTNVDKMRARGYRAAEAKASELVKYAVSQEDYDAHEAARQARRRTMPIVPSAVRVTGISLDDGARIARQLSVRAGQPLDVGRLEKDLLLLSGTDRFELLTYNLAEDAAGTRLEINARAKPNGPAFLALGVELNNIDSVNFAMTVAGRTTIYDVVGTGSEVKLDFAVGTRLGVGGELYRSIGVPWLFAAPRVFAGRVERNRFVGDRLVGEYWRRQADAGFDLGVNFGRRAQLRVGVDAAHLEETLRVGDPSLPEANGAQEFASARFVYDGQDSQVVPSRGLYAGAGARRFFSAPAITGPPAIVDVIQNPQEFWQAEFDVTGFHSIGRRNRIFFRAAAGTSFDAHPYFNDFSLGGPFRMSAYLNDELRGPSVALAAAGYMRQLPRLPSWVGGRAYLAVWVEGGSAFQSRSAITWHQDAAVGLIIDSLIGPVFIGGSVGPGGHSRVYFSLGPIFR
jgi:NTE family protein